MKLFNMVKKNLDEENRKRAGKLVELFHSHVRGDTVLDVGCLDGSILQELTKLNPKISGFGVDIEQNMKMGFPLVLYNGAQIPFKTNSVDTVTCIFVLHHAKHPIKLLQEFNRVSKKHVVIIEDLMNPPVGGFLVKSLHYLFDFLVLFISIFKRIKWQPGFPYNFKSDKDWLNIFRKLELKSVYEKNFKLLPRAPVNHKLYILDTGKKEEP